MTSVLKQAAHGENRLLEQLPDTNSFSKHELVLAIANYFRTYSGEYSRLFTRWEYFGKWINWMERDCFFENQSGLSRKWHRPSLSSIQIFGMGSVTSAFTRRTRNAFVKVGSEPDHDSGRNQSAPETAKSRSMRLNTRSNQIGRQSTQQSLSEVLNGQGCDGTQKTVREPRGSRQSGKLNHHTLAIGKQITTKYYFIHSQWVNDRVIYFHRYLFK